MPLAVTQAGSAASACRVARDKAAQTLRVMARLPVALQTRARLVRSGASGRVQRRRLRHHVTAQHGVAVAQQLRTAPSGPAIRPLGPRGAPRSARLRVLVCTKQTGAASNAAWLASPFKTVTSWTPDVACDPAGSAW